MGVMKEEKFDPCYGVRMRQVFPYLCRYAAVIAMVIAAIVWVWK